MKPINPACPAGKPVRNRRAAVRLGTLVVILLCLGIGALALSVWMYSHVQMAPGTQTTGSGQPAGLSEASKAVLKQLGQPVEIRFYSLLDPAAANDSLRAFSARVDGLLTDYQNESGGKLKVKRFNSAPAAGGAAAFADGLRAFNLDKGDGCYLGLAVDCNGHKETLAQLLPEWEPALEPDVSRAIARVAEAASAPAPTAAGPAATDPAVIEEVKRALPDYANLSVKQGSDRLRDTALKEFTAAVKQMKTELDTAQQRLAQAQAGGSESEQQDAMKNLQQLQAAQTEKIKEITARSRAQIEAFEKLKAAGR